MIRKLALAAALAATVFAAPAWAGKLHVVVPHYLDGSTEYVCYDNYLNQMKIVLDRLGVDAVFMRQDAVVDRSPYRASNAGIRDSVFVDDAGRSMTFAGRIILDWYSDIPVGNRRLTGMNPNALTLSTGWPQIPTALLGPTRQVGGTVINTSATCSTGVVGAGISAHYWGAATNFQHSSYLPGTGIVWKGAPSYWRKDGSTTGQWRLTFSERAGGTGITRNIVAHYSSNASYGVDGEKECDDCDGIPAPGFRNDTPSADTTFLWARYRSSREPAPIFFSVGLYPSQTGLDYPVVNLAMLIAAMDSASGGRIIGQKRGWTPIKIGYGVDNALVHSDANGNLDESYRAGLNPRDSNYVKAHLDSLGSLRIPWTAFVNCNLDTMNTYAGELKWFIKNGATFAPSPRKGLGSAYAPGASGGGAEQWTDPWGWVRPRTLVSLSRLNNGGPCDGTDSTTSCILSYARDGLEARIRALGAGDGRMSRALLAFMSDYIPTNMTARDLPGQGPTSVEAAALRAGYTHLIVNTTPFGVNPSASWALGAGFTALNDGNARALGAVERTVRVYGQSATATPQGTTVYTPTDYIGSVRWVAYRNADAAISSTSKEMGGHALVDEFMAGVFTGNWYPTQINDSWNRGNYYYHTFRTYLSAVVVPLGTLGATDAAGARVQTPGWWYIKHSYNMTRAINKLAGREVIKVVRLDEL